MTYADNLRKAIVNTGRVFTAMAEEVRRKQMEADRKELDTLWQQALTESIKDGEQFTRYHFAALVAAAEREAWEHKYARLQDLMEIRETQPNKPCCLAEREINAQIAEVAYRQYKDTEKAHEKLSPEPFRPELYGFNTKEILLSKEIAYEIRARGKE